MSAATKLCSSGVRNPITHSSMCYLDGSTGVFRECFCPLASCVADSLGRYDCNWTGFSFMLVLVVVVPWVYYLTRFMHGIFTAMAAKHKADPDDGPLMGVYKLGHSASMGNLEGESVSLVGNESGPATAGRTFS